MIEVPVFGLLLTLLIPLAFCFYQAKSKKSKPLPPLCKGWIPWLGCAIEFGKSPLDFIAEKRKLGPVFTLYVAGERLTFITEAEDFHYFFQSPFVDFQKAVQDPVLNVASVSKTSFFKYHTKIHDLVKGRLASSRLGNFSEGLCQEFKDQLKKLGNQGNGDLILLVRKTMYAAVMNNLFGKDMLPVKDEKEFEKIEKMFVIFDDHFEYGARLPPLFLSDWSSAKKYLLNLFSGVVKKLQTNKSKTRDEDVTLLESLLQLVQDEYRPNYSLLLLWASLANAIPITFWTLAFILHDERVLLKLREELTEVFGQAGIPQSIREEDLKRLPYLKWCVLEAVRMRPTGIITRRVVQSFTLRDMKIPEGDMLMLSPFWSHRNEKYFPEPNRFNPERWKEADIEKNVFLDGFVAFGGGRYQCPGRWYALLEIQMYVAMFLQMFDCKLLTSSVPEPSKKHVVGTQQPDGPCSLEYRLRT